MLLLLSLDGHGRVNGPFLPIGKSDSAQQSTAFRLTNFVLQFDNRNERYHGTSARMRGLRVGLELNKRFRFGMGFYGNSRFYPYNQPGLPDSMDQTVRFNYTTVFLEYVAFSNYRWELSFPFSYGRGKIALNHFLAPPNSTPVFLEKETIPHVDLLDFAIAGHYKFFSWAGIGSGLGYRQVLLDPEHLRTAFSSPYFVVKLKIFMGYIYRNITDPASVRAEKHAYQEKRKNRKKLR